MLAEFTTDKHLVGYVFNELKEFIGDEDSPSVEDVDWDYHFARDLFISIHDDFGELCGVVAFYFKQDGEWEIHMNMLQQHRGEKSVWAYNAAVAMLRLKVPVHKLVAVIPNYYPNVYGFAEKRGFLLKDVVKQDRIYELELA